MDTVEAAANNMDRMREYISKLEMVARTAEAGLDDMAAGPEKDRLKKALELLEAIRESDLMPRAPRDDL